MTTPSANLRPNILGNYPSGVGVHTHSEEDAQNRSVQISLQACDASEVLRFLTNPVDDPTHLAHVLENVTSLDLTGMAIGDEGLKRLCRALTINRTVTKLILDEMRPGGLSWRVMGPIAAMLGVNSTIKELSLKNNQINDVAASKLLMDLIELESVGLEQLSLSNNKIQSQTLECLPDLLSSQPGLTRFFLDGNQINGDAVRVLTEILSKPQTALMVLALENNFFTDQDKDLLHQAMVRFNFERARHAQHIQSPSSRSLNMTVDSYLHFLPFGTFSANPLETALLNKACVGAPFSDAEFSRFANICRQLPSREFDQVIRLSPMLDFSEQSMSKAELHRILQVLKASSALTSLSLRNMTPPLDHEDVQAIVGFIKSNPSIKRLDLSQNKIEGEGAIAIVRALSSEASGQSNSSLGVSPPGRQSPIQTLSLAGNQISAWTREPIIEAIGHCSNVTCLDLSDNKFMPHIVQDSKPGNWTSFEPMDNMLRDLKEVRANGQAAHFKSHPNLVILTEIPREKQQLHKPPRTGQSSKNENDPIWRDFRYFGVIPLLSQEVYGFNEGPPPIEHLQRCTLEEGQSGRLPWLIKEANIKYLAFFNLSLNETEELTRLFAREQKQPESLKLLAHLTVSFKPEAWKNAGSMEAFFKALPAKGAFPLKVRVSVDRAGEALYPKFLKLLDTAGCQLEKTGY